MARPLPSGHACAGCPPEKTSRSVLLQPPDTPGNLEGPVPGPSPSSEEAPTVLMDDCFRFLIDQNEAMVWELAGIRQGQARSLKEVLRCLDLLVNKTHMSNVKYGVKGHFICEC